MKAHKLQMLMCLAWQYDMAHILLIFEPYLQAKGFSNLGSQSQFLNANTVLLKSLKYCMKKFGSNTRFGSSLSGIHAPMAHHQLVHTRTA